MRSDLEKMKIPLRFDWAWCLMRLIVNPAVSELDDPIWGKHWEDGADRQIDRQTDRQTGFMVLHTQRAERRIHSVRMDIAK